MLEKKDLEFLTKACSISNNQAQNVIELFDENMTVPFISRYRKEKTNSMDEEKVQNAKDLYDYIIELNKRKDTVIKTIKEQGKLTKELENIIKTTFVKNELEDIYLPYKPKRRTKATIAKENGYEPLSISLLDINLKGNEFDIAKNFYNTETDIKNALEGSGYIIAEKYSENAECRKNLRNYISENALLISTVTDKWKDKRSKFEQYYNFKETLKTIPSHRILAIRRGEKEKILKTYIDTVKDNLLEISSKYFFSENHPRNSFLHSILKDSLKRLIVPSVELDIKLGLKIKSDEEAIEVFASNIENLLLSPPARNLKVMAIDPGYRTGCKVTLLDETGKIINYFTIYLNSPKTEEKAAKSIKNNIRKHGIDAVIIGNGTASRETRDFILKNVNKDLIVSLISEAGASVYSASKTGREEFPDLDVTVRGSISIGHRFQDPLAELVKIEPKSIGVGQYQHDVNQTLLKKRLDYTVISVVNRVGVDLNTASYHLLKYVAGIGETLSKNIVKYRDKNGLFKNRKELLNVKLYGEKVFLQSAGFLRINNQDNCLDSTGIHPESYFILERIAKDNNLNIKDIIGNKDIIKKIKPQVYISDKFGLPTITDILSELLNPGRDPRKDFKIFEFSENINSLSDLKEGMILTGVVSNVTKFGAFVDIGVHQDGLVHISEISNRYISSPEKVVSVGDKIKVKILKIDSELNRISLSIKALEKIIRHKKKKKQKKNIYKSIEDLKKKWGAH